MKFRAKVSILYNIKSAIIIMHDTTKLRVKKDINSAINYVYNYFSESLTEILSRELVPYLVTFDIAPITNRHQTH